jgi:hypothetical protein
MRMASITRPLSAVDRWPPTVNDNQDQNPHPISPKRGEIKDGAPVSFGVSGSCRTTRIRVLTQIVMEVPRTVPPVYIPTVYRRPNTVRVSSRLTLNALDEILRGAVMELASGVRYRISATAPIGYRGCFAFGKAVDHPSKGLLIHRGRQRVQGSFDCACRLASLSGMLRSR